MAVKRSGARSGAFCWAMRALVLAGLPTTRILTSSAALSDSALPCTREDGAVGLEQVAALHALRAGPRRRPGSATLASSNASLASSVRTMPASSGKAQSSSSMATPFERAERRRDLEQLQDDGLIGAEHRSARDAEQDAVADLAGGPGDGDADGILAHGDDSWNGRKRTSRHYPAGPGRPQRATLPAARARTGPARNGPGGAQRVSARAGATWSAGTPRGRSARARVRCPTACSRRTAPAGCSSRR